MLDDISWMQGLGSAVTSDATLFDVRTATNWNIWNRDGNVGQKVWSAQNPPSGAIITYYLKTQQPVTLTASEKNGGRQVRRITAPGAAGSTG